MGNYKFRFSDMIPNAWFHKLKDMSHSKPRSNFPKTTLNSSKINNNKLPYSSSLPPHTLTHSHQRKSYYFTRDLSPQPDSPPIIPDPAPRNSSRKRRSTNRNHRRQPRLVSSSISAGCSCRATVDWANPDHEDSRANSGRDCSGSPGQSSSSLSEADSVLTEYGSDRGDCSRSMVSWSTPCKCKCKCGATNDDIILDIDSSRNLAPILTKRRSEPMKVHQRTSAEFSETNAYGSLSVKVVKEDFTTAAVPVRRLPAKSGSPGMRLRVNSPKIGNRRMMQGRRSNSSRRSKISESLAVVKVSEDPRRDFRESMVEMILENKIRGSSELEELLACYLSLNSDEYHDLIINVFKQIWFDFIHLRLN